VDQIPDSADLGEANLGQHRLAGLVRDQCAGHDPGDIALKHCPADQQS
jgi:hypothetical protein